MPRMSKKRRLEWSFFLRQVKVGNTTCDRITYNDLCRGCTHTVSYTHLDVYKRQAYHHIENGFDDKLDYQTLEEAEAAAQGHVAGTMERDVYKRQAPRASV